MRQLRAVRIFVGLSLLLSPLVAQGQAASTVFERVKDSVFVVKALDSEGAQKALGSAVLLPSGKFATNYHVVSEGTLYQLGRGGKFVPATLFAGDSDKDIGLLDAPGISGKPALLGKAASLKVGQPVYAIGAPQGLELSISEGIVSQLRGAPPPMIQTTAAISPGSSGGGLFDAQGRLVGLTALYIEGGQNLNFALPVEWIAEVKPGVATTIAKRSQGAWLAGVTGFLNSKDWTGLRDWDLAWTKSEPKNADAWCSLGFAYALLQRSIDALDAYRQALRINPEYAEAWLNLGAAYGDLQRSTEAINAYRQALRINPELATAWLNLGSAYASLQRSSEAIDAYRQALRITPEDAYAWLGLGNSYGSLLRYTEAIDAYRQALRINPEFADAWGNLGVAYAYGSPQRNIEAIDAYRQALRINPEDDYAWLNLGVAYLTLHRNSEAIDAYRHAVRINPKNADAWFNIGSAYHRAGNDSAALDAVKTLRRLDPAKADELFNLIVPR